MGVDLKRVLIVASDNPQGLCEMSAVLMEDSDEVGAILALYEEEGHLIHSYALADDILVALLIKESVAFSILTKPTFIQ